MKRICILLLTMLVCTVGCSSQEEKADDSQVSKDISKEWGNYLAQSQKDPATEKQDSDTIYAQGKTASISVSEMEQATYFYELQGNTPEQAEEMAYSYMKESAAIYAKALEEGYKASEEEVSDYVDGLRTSFENGELSEISQKEMEDVIDGFGNADDYWEYEKQVYRKELVSQKYVDALEKDFFADASASQEDWVEYFQNYKDELVEKEVFQKTGASIE